MKTLLYKDLHMMKFIIIILVVLQITFSVITFISNDNSLLTIMYPTLLAGMFAASTFSYDEKYKTAIYNSILPCSKKVAVAAKYLFAFLIVVLLIVIQIIINIITKNVFTIEKSIDNLSLIAILLIGGLLTPSIVFPLNYKFGFDKSKIIYYITLGLIFGLIGFSSGYIHEAEIVIPDKIVLPNSYLLIIIAVGIYIVSWLISSLIVKKNNFK